jgi:hypothetical protein
VVRDAIQSPEPSVVVEQSIRKHMLRIAVALKLGEMGETRFQVGDHWKQHFIRQRAQSNSPLSVGKLREWIDLPQPMGLPSLVQDLVILTFAEQTNRAFRQNGGPVPVEIGALKDDMVLEEVALPSDEVWRKAGERAKAIFGIPTSPLLNAANLSALAGTLTDTVKRSAADVVALLAKLAEVRSASFPELQNCPRLATAREAQVLVKGLSGASGNDVIKQLAEADLTANYSALGASISSAGTVERTLDSAEWKIFQGIRVLTDERKVEADKIWDKLASAFSNNEYAVALGPEITRLKAQAVDLLTRQVKPPQPPPPPELPELPEPPELPLPHKSIVELKALYGRSQVVDDDLPGWITSADEILKIHFFGTNQEDWKSMIVVSPTMKALIDLDAGARVDLKAQTLKLPRFGQTLKLTVDPKHFE